MNDYQNRINFFEYLKPENFSITLEPIDLHFVQKPRILVKKCTKWDPFLPQWKGNLAFIKWPISRPGLRFSIIQNNMLPIKKDEWAVRGKTYEFKFCGKTETCYVICSGYPEKIHNVLDVILDRYFKINECTNLKRKSSEDSSDLAFKRLKST